MPRKPEGIMLLGLVAVLVFSVTAAQATAPIAKDIPDIRGAIDPSGTGSAAETVLDLDDYVRDPDDRNADGVQNALTWAESSTLGDDNVGVVANDLQVSIPSNTAPESGQSTFSVTDQDTQQDFVGPVTVKTTTLLAAPLVDDYLHLGDANSAVPYSWCIEEGQTLKIEPGNQPGGGGRLFLSTSVGEGQCCFYGASTILDASAQVDPLAPGGSPITLKGLKFGSGSSVSLEATNLSIDAGLSGLFATALAGFSDWVRVTVTRTYEDGSGDAYSVAIGDILTGVTSAPAVFNGQGVTTSGGGLSGAELANVTEIDADAVYGFEGISAADFMGYESADGSGGFTAFGADYDGSATGSRSTQTTSWAVSSIGQSGNVVTGGGQPGNVSVTSTGVPAATYPGATSGRALKIELNRADNTGLLASHRGIPDSAYAPGDVLTFSMNVYVDLNYSGGNADTINEGVNGITFAMALTNSPVGDSGSFNYLFFAPAATGRAANAQAFPNGGFTEDTNVIAALHGKWTQHQVSYRVPEIGQSVAGNAGTGDLVDPSGVSAKFLIARIDTDNPGVNQTVWVDNICLVKCPSPLCFAHGAVNAPMVAAGFGATANTNHILGNSLPAALARGAVINGNFSTAGNAAAPNVGASLPSTTAGFDADNNASKGWPENPGNNAVAFIGSGAAGVALRYPDFSTYNQALVLTPALASNFPNPSNAGTINGDTGLVAGNSAGVNSGFIDMLLASDSVTPGLRVSDVAYAAGTGGASTQNGLEDNVSGVFGVRLFATTNAADPADNPQLAAIFTDADVTRGFVGQFPPQVLPNGADTLGGGTSWGEYTVSGNFISFTSPQQSTWLSSFGGGNAGTIAALAADNPSRQLGNLQITRGASPHIANIRSNADVLGQVFAPVLGTATFNPANAGYNATPGRYATATVFVDEVSIYAVRDSERFYDEDLAAFAAIP